MNLTPPPAVLVSRPWWKRLGDNPDRMVMWFCIGLLVVVGVVSGLVELFGGKQ